MGLAQQSFGAGLEHGPAALAQQSFGAGLEHGPAALFDPHHLRISPWL